MKPPPIFRLPILQLIAATTAIRFAFAGTTGLGVDESYMVTAGRVLSLGYFDHPPASWWLCWGAAHLLGTEAPVVVRLPFILLFAMSQFLVWRIGCLVASPRAAFWTVAALNVSPVFGLTTGSWVLPDGPLDTALLGATLCLLHALPGERGATWWWAGVGACAGLALFSKYSAILTMGGALLYLAASQEHRRWLRRPEPYAAAVLAAVVFSPVIIWNARHGWVSFAFQGDRAMGLRFRPWLPLATLAGEALFVLPWLWVPMIVALLRGFRGEWRHRLLVWLAAPPIIGFALISAWSSQRILYHWAAPGYLMLFPLLGAEGWLRRCVVGSAALVLLVIVVIAGQIQLDWLGGSLTRVMLTDPTAEGLDWLSVRDDLRERGLLTPGTIVAVPNWRDAGKIGYALGPNVIMLCLSPDARQFGLAHPLGDYQGRTVLVLEVDPAVAISGWFERTEAMTPVSVRLDGRVLRTVSVLRGVGLRPER